MKHKNPKNWNRKFDIVREREQLISIWLSPANHPEGERVATLHVDYVPSLISSLKQFEQREGRNEAI